MKMSFCILRRSVVCGLAVLSAGLSGCEWDSSSGTNSRYNFVNFSGVYRGINGGLLVTDYSSELSTPSGEGSVGSTNNVASEQIATGNGIKDQFAGSLDQNNVVAGTLTIEAQGTVFTFTDPEPFDGVLVAAEGASGNINYNSGAWSLDFNGLAPDNGKKIVASYKYYLEPESTDPDTGTGSGTRGNATSGVSGAEIYSFTIEHYGNDLRVIDNNGKTYSGKLGDVRSTSGVNQDSTTASVDAGDSFIANYDVTGKSAAGKSVTMAGTLQGVVQSVSGQSGILDSRQMFGTWIEANGVNGDIQGEASPITINISSNTSTN